ncbi:hypothetical protein V6266_22420, partial [Enterobacter asburiae]
IGPDPRNFNQRVSLGRNDLLIRTFPNCAACWLIDGSRSIAKRILSFKVVVETGAIPTCPLLAQAVFMAIENSAIAAVYRSNIEFLNIVILSP